MQSIGIIFGYERTRRTLAIIGCLALLYFVAGATLHHHDGDSSDSACHVCQVLHLPALAAAPLGLIPQAQQVGWHAAIPQHAAPLDSFAFHHASRAPPTA
jgi:hypothetical protein